MALEMSRSAGSNAVRRLLDACAEVYSSWFMAMRRTIRKERVRQQLFREENGLPKIAKIPYERPVASACDSAVAAMCESVVRAMFGDPAADYARDKYSDAIQTGDARAFKIRLLVIKARDSLKNTALYEEFCRGMESCIAKAEKIAGCIQDPSPRRMSRAERERKKKLSRKKKRHKAYAPELPLVWPGKEDKNSTTDCFNDNYGPGKAPLEAGVGPSNEKLRESSEESAPSGGCDEKSDVTHDVTVTKRKNARRKAGTYNSIDEILDDIESGRIEPYTSPDEICADMKKGLITDVEALMFAAAMDRYAPEISEEDIEDEDGEEMEFGEDNGGENDEYREEKERGGAERPSYSYNPRGFGECQYSSDWDEW